MQSSAGEHSTLTLQEEEKSLCQPCFSDANAPNMAESKQPMRYRQGRNGKGGVAPVSSIFSTQIKQIQFKSIDGNRHTMLENTEEVKNSEYFKVFLKCNLNNRKALSPKF